MVGKLVIRHSRAILFTDVVVSTPLLAQLVAPSGEFVLSERPAMPLKGLDGEHVTHGEAWR